MNAVIAFALRQRVLMVLLLLFMFGVGIASFVKLNIEAYPDPVPPLVDVVTQNPGQSAEEIERYITIPIEIQMAGIPNVTAVRTISLFGLSDVKVQFPTRSPTTKPSNGSSTACRSSPRCPMARRRRSLPTARSGRSIGTG